MGSIRPGLSRVGRLLDDTDLSWRAIHVAGTNGKGTTCAYISAMLNAYNRSAYRSSVSQKFLRHGRYTSPHLINYHDGISIDQKLITAEDFLRHERHMRQRDVDLSIEASNFELLTAVAFRHFAQPSDGWSRQAQMDGDERHQVDIAVVEVGMGGRDDATNILGQHVVPGDRHRIRAMPLVTAFTKIGLDHQGFLGNSLEEIAANKAGIMKPGVPVVLDESNDGSVSRLIRSRAEDRLVVDLFAPTSTDTGNVDHSAVIARLFSSPQEPPHTTQNLIVAFQSTWVALCELGRLPKHVWEVDSRSQCLLLDLANDMVADARRTKFPGRLQYLDIQNLTGHKYPILLDGAHNPQSAIVLRDEVQRLRQSMTTKSPNIHWILAMTDTKDACGILQLLLEAGDTVYPTEFGPVSAMPWVTPTAADTLGHIAQQLDLDVKVQLLRGGLLKLLQYVGQTAHDERIVIAGSLYLVGDVLRLLSR